MTKRVLVSGIGGFMGSHVMRHILQSTNWEIVGLDSFQHKGKTDRITQQLEGISGVAERITIITHDLLVPISRQMDEKIGHIDYVLNIASESHVDRSITEPREFIHNNVELMLTMLEWVRHRNSTYVTKHFTIEKFIQISTDEVYGPASAGYNHREGEAHKPSNPYSASKAAQEDICFAYWRTYGLPIIITNTMNIIGELQDPEKYIPMTIKKVFSGERVSVHANADGSKIGSRYYLHARNQADALLFVLKNISPSIYGEEVKINGQTGIVDSIERFNIVGEKETNNLELAQLVAQYASKELDYEFVDFHSSRPGHDLRYALDGSRLQARGWKAPLPFEESLRRTVEWTIAHPEWMLDD